MWARDVASRVDDEEQPNDRRPLRVSGGVDSWKRPTQDQRAAEHVLQPAAGYKCVAVVDGDGEQPD